MSTHPVNLGVLVFDLDGTLLDSILVQTEAFESTMQSFAPRSEGTYGELYVRTSGAPLENQVLAALDGAEADVSALISNFWTTVDRHDFRPFDEVDEALSELGQAGYAMAVSSGASPESVMKKLASTGLDRFFDIALGSGRGDDLLVKGPAHFAEIARLLRLTMRQFVECAAFIGDTVHDVETASAAGLVSISRSGTFTSEQLRASGTRHVISDLSELVSLLRRGGGFEPISVLRRKGTAPAGPASVGTGEAS